MGKRCLLLIVVLVLLQSCGVDDTDKLLQRKTRPPHSILNFKVYNTESEKLLSFPLLFDANLIQKHKISKITRCFYLLDASSERRDISSEVLREKREYYFQKSGRPRQIDFTYYFDDRVVGKQRIKYPNAIDYYGYSPAVLQRDSGAVITDKIDVNFGFHLHRLVKKTRKYLALEDQQSGELLFFMLKKNYWGALSVDSILHPRPIDRVVLGSPHFPFMFYRVENKVKQKDVITVAYRKDTKQIKRIITSDYPFNSSRTFIYKKSGNCNTYIDSTFSGDHYLARTVTVINFDALKMPIKVRHIKETGFRKLGVTSIERITYE